MALDNDIDLVIVLEADRYAAAEHARVGQKRKYSEEPYIIHPRQVAGYVRTSIHNTAMAVATALLHDVLEDTLNEGETVEAGAQRMQAHFAQAFQPTANAEQAGLLATELVERVLQVTDVSKLEDGNRKARKHLDAQHAGRANPEQKTVKLADIKSNMPSIVKHDPGFARRWVAEKVDVYPLLEGGDPALFVEVGEMLAAYMSFRFDPDAYEVV